MFDSFFAAFHVVMPMALLICVGTLIRKIGIIDRPNMRALDQVTFNLFILALYSAKIRYTNTSGTMTHDLQQRMFLTIYPHCERN